MKSSVICIIFIFLISGNCDTEKKEETRIRAREWQNSVTFHILVPLTGLVCILLGRKEFFTKILLQIDRCCVSVLCPSFSKREKLLKWASENLPKNWSSPSRTLSGGVVDLWKDGALLCTLINMYVPGACSNPPRHWKKPPTHAQALAYKYFGITPIFTEIELNEEFSPMQERKFLNYLQDLQNAMKKRETRDVMNFSRNYIARGMGLCTGEQYRKSVFYIYSNDIKNSGHSNSVLVYIQGPYGTEGTATIPGFSNSICRLDKIKTGNGDICEKRNFFFNTIALDFTSFVNKNEIKNNTIRIHVEMENDRAKITYIPENYGIYMINLITNGEILHNSPFVASIMENFDGKRENFLGENTKEIVKIQPSGKKKISNFIDCVDEKIWKTEGGDEGSKGGEVPSKRPMSIVPPFSKACSEESRPDGRKIDFQVEGQKIEIEEKPNFRKIDFENTFKPDEFLQELKENKSTTNNYVEALKTILLTKISQLSPSDDTKTIKNFVNNLNRENENNTSPICTSHIVPEVSNFSNLTLAEKRKFFSRQTNKTSSFVESDSTFSTKENERIRPENSNSPLKVLAVIETIKKTTNLNKETSKSVPNLSKNSYEKIKKYWTNFPLENQKIDLSKSVDNLKIDIVPKIRSVQSLKNIENLNFISLDERKRKLLRDDFEKENLGSRFVFKRKIENSEIKIDSEITNTKLKRTTSLRFVKAINFFKNLEKTSKINGTSRNSKSRNRRFSLDSDQKKRNVSTKLGGSLRLPSKTIDKFAITQIYFDIIMKNGKNSFKGAPNSKALTKTLKSLTVRNEQEDENRVGEENFEIEFTENLLEKFNKNNKKRRKSLKSLFDQTIYY